MASGAPAAGVFLLVLGSQAGSGRVQGVHRAAAQGFTAGAQTYVRGRPEYPAEVAEWLAGDLDLGAGKTVLELGAGTGKFTGRLLATGAEVIAVEPVAAMLRELMERYPAVRAKAGTAEEIPVPDGSVDAVVCAQSFHWFATREVMREIGRVLRPDGALGLVWNVRDTSVAWVAALSRLIEPFEGDTPRFHSGVWRALFPTAGFGEVLERRFRHAHLGPAEKVVVDRVLSISFIAALPAAEQRMVADEVRALVKETPELRDREIVSFPYETMAFRYIKVA